MDSTVSVSTARTRAAESSAVVRKAVWRLMPLIFICYFFAFFDRINISFAKTALQVDLGISNTAYGLGASLFTIGYVLFEVPSNMILFKVGTRQWIARIMISWGLATAAMIFVTTEWQFYALRFLIGSLEAGFSPGIIYYMTTWFPTSYRGRSTSYLFLAQAFSGMVGGPLAGTLLTYMDGVGGQAGWHWMFLFGGLPCIVLGVIVFKFLDNRIEDAKWLTADEKKQLLASIERTPQTGRGHSLLGALKTPGFLTLAIVYFMIQMAAYGLNFWAPDLIKTAGGGNYLVVGALTAIPYVFGAITMVLIGRHADKTGNRRYYSMACLFAGFVGFTATAYFSHDVTILVIALTIIGCGIIGGMPTFWAMPPKLVVGAGAAGGIALINTLGQMGGIVSPIMVGSIKDMTGSASPALYVIGGLCLLACLILGFFSSKQIKANDRELDGI